MGKLNCILLIDDDGTANFINCRIVKKLEISDRIEMVMNGEKALNFIQYYADTNDGECPELIFLDLNMPVLDGFEFLEYFYRKAFSNKEKIKIYILTTSSYQRDMDIIKKYPNLQYIIKPLTEEKLIEVLSPDVKLSGEQ